MKPDSSAPARDKILFYLKTRGPLTAAAVATRLDVTPMAVRQHLYELERLGLVTHEDRRARVGRPARHWALTPKAAERFPDSHGQLMVSLIEAARTAFGEAGLERLVAERVKQQSAAYRRRLPGTDTPIEKRIAAMVNLRREEGYMAEWQRERDGSFTLVENHCPVGDAARVCQGLCGGELELFRASLGRDVRVERIEHALEGARRCSYRIVAPRT